ncbi:MAG: hypothetical protein RR139_11360 [Lachnospiraceae bacterium]
MERELKKYLCVSLQIIEDDVDGFVEEIKKARKEKSDKDTVIKLNLERRCVSNDKKNIF